MDISSSAIVKSPELMEFPIIVHLINCVQTVGYWLKMWGTYLAATLCG